MPRIRAVDSMPTAPDDEDQPTRVNASIAAITAHRPEISRGFGAVSRALSDSGTLSPRLVELIRLRIAFHNQCRSCMAVRYTPAIDDGLDEDVVCSLEAPDEADDLTDAERAALRFADLFATDHLAIDDAVYDDLRQHFTEGELVEIGFNCAMDVGMGRLVSTWHVTEDLPDRFRASTDALLTPWGGESVVVPGRHR